MRPAQTQPVTRREFISRFMRESGLTYAQSIKAYETMCRTVEDGIVSGSKIHIGGIGCLNPNWQPSREVHMHFRVLKGGKIDRNVQRTFNVEGHFTYKFNLYQSFVRSRALKWMDEVPVPGI